MSTQQEIPVALIQWALPIVAALNALSVPYYLGGSVAVAVWGYARATDNVDLVVLLTAIHAVPLLDQLSTEYYLAPEALREAIRLRRMANAIHFTSLVRINLWVPPQGPFTAATLARARLARVSRTPARTVTVAAPEDVLLHKLLRIREVGHAGPRHQADVAGILEVQEAGLDRGYLQQWAARLGLADLLTQALAAASL